MTLRTIVALGVTQCINWGVLYYAFGALLLPMQRDLGASQTAIGGAFSVGLLVSALTAPTVGRHCDKGKAVLLIRNGAAAAAILLGALAAMPHLATVYLVWAGLGVCMAMALYEPAFALVGRSLANPRERLRALSIVTVLGGLASTAILPMTAVLLDRSGWRWTVAALGLFMAASAAITAVLRIPDVARCEPASPVAGRDDDRGMRQPRLSTVAAAFALASFIGAAFTATAVAAFVERGLTPTRAMLMLGLFGAMQVPGRVLLTAAVFERPALLAAASLTLQAAGLSLLAAAPPSFVPAGVALFAVGNGMLTLVRPHVVQTMFAMAQAGARNGTIARGQQFARAAGPFSATVLVSVSGYRTLLAALAVGSSALAAWWWAMRRAHEREHPKGLDHDRAAVTGVL